MVCGQGWVRALHAQLQSPQSPPRPAPQTVQLHIQRLWSSSYQMSLPKGLVHKAGSCLPFTIPGHWAWLASQEPVF